MHIFLSEKNGMAITPVFLGESPGAADIGHPALPWLLHVLFPLHDERGEDVMIIGKKGGICMAELSDEKIKVLQKFGFQVNGIIRHKKMGIELDVGELAGCETADDLEEHVKTLLRNQCFLRR